VDIVQARRLSTDKAPNPSITAWKPHEYHIMYQRWLAPLRLKKFRMMRSALAATCRRAWALHPSVA
jgi:hypothetical protein